MVISLTHCAAVNCSKISDIQDISSLASCNCFSGFHEICAYNHYCDVV